MAVNNDFEKEKQDLLNNKRPYETAAFIIFAILLLQQVGYFLYHFVRYLFKINGVTFMSFTNVCTSNLQGWVLRLAGLTGKAWLGIIIFLFAYALYYFFVYIFVWEYCRKRGYAKWTWTTLVVFLPVNILLMPAYIWYLLYIFRPYIMRFIKKAVVEYKEFDPNQQFEEELVETIVEEPEEVEPQE